MQATAQEVREFIVENFLFGQDSPSLTHEKSLIDSGIIDSTGVMELVDFLEQRYDILVDDEELEPENLDSIGGVVAFVNRKSKTSTVCAK